MQICKYARMLFATCFLWLAICYLLTESFLSETCYYLQKLFPFARCCTSRNFFVLIKWYIDLTVGHNIPPRTHFVDKWISTNMYLKFFSKKIEYLWNLLVLGYNCAKNWLFKMIALEYDKASLKRNYMSKHSSKILKLFRGQCQCVCAFFYVS